MTEKLFSACLFGVMASWWTWVFLSVRRGMRIERELNERLERIIEQVEKQNGGDGGD